MTQLAERGVTAGTEKTTNAPCGVVVISGQFPCSIRAAADRTDATLRGKQFSVQFGTASCLKFTPVCFQLVSVSPSVLLGVFTLFNWIKVICSFCLSSEFFFVFCIVRTTEFIEVLFVRNAICTMVLPQHEFHRREFCVGSVSWHMFLLQTVCQERRPVSMTFSA